MFCCLCRIWSAAENVLFCSGERYGEYTAYFSASYGLEVAIVGLRLAALNTPSMLSTPLSVIAGLVMGEFSVKSGWFNSEVMLYMAFVAVANYTQPNFELGYALKFMRLQLLLLTAVFNWIGFLAGTIVVIVSICFNKTLSGRSYLNVKLN